MSVAGTTRRATAAERAMGRVAVRITVPMIVIPIRGQVVALPWLVTVRCYQVPAC